MRRLSHAAENFEFCLMKGHYCGRFNSARAHGMWTYESRQGRNAATAVCSASAVVTLALLIYDLRFAIDACNVNQRVNRKS
jgi:hypothetical protein